MKRRRISVVLCFLAIAAAIVYVRSYAQNAAPIKPSAQSKQTIRQQDIYEQMFRHYAALQNKAQIAERDGQDGVALRTFYQRQGKLTGQQTSQLDAVASDCISELERLDARAKQVVDEARARVPGGQLKKGETPPPPPAELYDLQQKREAKVLQAKDQLNAKFGDAEFARFDEFVQRTIAANMKSSAPGDRHLLARPPLQRAQPQHP